MIDPRVRDTMEYASDVLTLRISIPQAVIGDAEQVVHRRLAGPAA